MATAEIDGLIDTLSRVRDRLGDAPVAAPAA